MYQDLFPQHSTTLYIYICINMWLHFSGFRGPCLDQYSTPMQYVWLWTFVHQTSPNHMDSSASLTLVPGFGLSPVPTRLQSPTHSPLRWRGGSRESFWLEVPTKLTTTHIAMKIHPFSSLNKHHACSRTQQQRFRLPTSFKQCTKHG